MPGLAKLNVGHSAWITSVSCPSVGQCVAGGLYSNCGFQGFVVSES